MAKMDFEKIFELNHFFEETKNEKQNDINTLKQSFSVLDNSFNNLLGKFLLVPLEESETRIEDDKADVKSSFKSFFDDFKQTANLLVGFHNKYTATKDYIDFGLATTIEKKFRATKESYDTVMKKANGLANRNFKEMIEYLNDAYFAYVYLLRGFNSIIDSHNTKHPNVTIARIADIPSPDSLGIFKNQDVSKFVKWFLELVPSFTTQSRKNLPKLGMFLQQHLF